MNKFKRIGLFLLSIPLAIAFNYFVTIRLLDFVNYFGFIFYIVILLVQIIGWFEIMIFFLDKWRKFDKIIVIIVYYVIFIFAFFARPKQRGILYNFNPLHIVEQFNSFNNIIIAIFNIGVFIPLVIINSLFIKKKKYNIYLCIIYSFAIELFQAILHRGIFDISDIILYFIGIALGIVTLNYLTEKEFL